MRNLNSLTKEKTKIPVIINEKAGKIPKNTTESLNFLNEGFINVGKSEREHQYNSKFMKNKEEEISKYMKKQDVESKKWKRKIKEYQITEKEIEEHINKLEKTSCGPDEITNDFIKKTSRWSSKIIKIMVIKALEVGKLPEQWKMANVTPIIKDRSGNKHSYKNYRPISVTSIVARIAERIIKRLLMEKVEKEKIIPNYQYGGKKKVGTIDALTQIWYEIQINESTCGETNTVFLDISKAFDRLKRKLLIWKLKNVVKISDPILRWIYEFLNNRTQRVKIHGSKSEWRSTKTGGPQGSVLLPVLFSIYISDIPIDNYKKGEERGAKFVDDICIYSTGNPINQINDLNKRIRDIFKWSNKWGVDFNGTKSKHMTLRSRVGDKNVDRTVKLGDKILEKVKKYKYLGILIDEKMKFDRHINEYVVKKINIEISKLRKCVGNKPSGKTMFGKIFWNTKLRPIIEYGSPIWSVNVNKTSMQNVEDVQTTFFREINRFSSRSCKKAILIDQSINDVKLRILAEKEKHLIKCKMGLVPEKIEQLYAKRNDPIVYDQKIVKNSQYPNGYRYVVKNRKNSKYKYKTTVKFVENKKMRSKQIDGNSAKETAMKRKEWIQNNIEKWWESRKPKEKVFSMTRNTEQYGVESIFDEGEMEGIIQRMITKTNTWKYVKNNIVKKSIISTQMKLWYQADEGKVMKKYKNTWYKDRVIDKIKDPMVYVIKKMRIGNSELQAHRKAGKMGICACGEEEETIEHYFLRCKKYRDIRVDMIKGVITVNKKCGMSSVIKSILGMYPEVFKSKTKSKKLENIIKENYKNVFQYMRKSKRFEKK